MAEGGVANKLIEQQVEVTRFEELEDTLGEVKLKQLLWDSQKEWDVTYKEWMKVSNFVNIYIIVK